MRIFYTGVTALSEVDRLCQRSDWVALGSFGLQLECAFLKHLPPDSQLIVGCTTEVGPRHTQMLKLQILKKARPDLLIILADRFHAKYGLFRGKQKNYVMSGSMNLTNSPSAELIVFQSDDGLFRAVADFHGRQVRAGKVVEAYAAQKLDPKDLVSLSSRTVRR